MLRILVIADDLTGAAEMAGIAFSRGFSVKIVTKGGKPQRDDTEVLVINTDTRNDVRKDAIEKTGNVIRENKVIKNVWIFKKTDSLLRGNIESEIETILSLTPYNSCVLIPANPSRRRTVQGGNYLVGNLPLNQTIYRQDPEFPRESSDIKKLIRDASDKLVSGKKLNEIRTGEILVPDISSIESIEKLIKNGIPEDVLTAGAADFFTAILGFKYKNQATLPDEKPDYPENKCFIIGSYSQNNYKDTELMDRSGYRIFVIPVSYNTSSDKYKEWEKELFQYASDHRRMAIMVPDDFINDKDERNELIINLGKIAKEIVRIKGEPIHFLVTGGRTASSVCEQLQWNELRVRDDNGKGVVTLSNPDSNHILTIKPGSYSWPDKILKKTGRNE